MLHEAFFLSAAFANLEILLFLMKIVNFTRYLPRKKPESIEQVFRF